MKPYKKTVFICTNSASIVGKLLQLLKGTIYTHRDIA